VGDRHARANSAVGTRVASLYRSYPSFSIVADDDGSPLIARRDLPRRLSFASRAARDLPRSRSAASPTLE